MEYTFIIIIISVIFILGAFVAFVNTLFYLYKGRSIFSSKSSSKMKFSMDFFKDRKSDFVITMASVLLSRLALVIITSLIAWICTKASPDLNFSRFRWLRWDASHYISIAEHGYQTVGDARNFIVFLPLYPFFIRLFNYIFRNYVISAYIVSYVSAVLSGYFLYLLVKNDSDESTAFRALKYYLIFPFSFFLFIPMSESLFMLFLLGAVYFARKKKWLLSGAFGYCCALTRMPGVFVAVPVFIEAAHDLFKNIRNKIRSNIVYINPYKDLWAKITGLFMIPMGFVTYLYINYSVHGEWLKFLEFQKNHWHNEAQPFYETLKTTVSCLLSDSYDLTFKLGVSIPNLLMFIIGVVILWYGIAKMRVSYVAFLVVYILTTYSPSWLLSAGRYMIGAFPIYIAFAQMTKRKGADILLTAFNLLLLIFFSSIYFMFGALY